MKGRCSLWTYSRNKWRKEGVIELEGHVTTPNRALSTNGCCREQRHSILSDSCSYQQEVFKKIKIASDQCFRTTKIYETEAQKEHIRMQSVKSSTCNNGKHCRTNYPDYSINKSWGNIKDGGGFY